MGNNKTLEILRGKDKIKCVVSGPRQHLLIPRLRKGLYRTSEFRQERQTQQNGYEQTEFLHRV